MAKYLRKKEAAEYLGVSLSTLELWMRRRVIPYRKIGRTVLFDPAELDETLERYRLASIGEGFK